MFLALPSLQRAIERAQQEIKPKNSVVEAAPEPPAEDLQPQEQSAFEKVAETDRLELLFSLLGFRYRGEG